MLRKQINKGEIYSDSGEQSPRACYVYRVQHKTTKLGPYVSGHMANVKMHYRRHPLPKRPKATWIFGFSSLTKLRKWFSVPERLFLKSQGFHIVRYDVRTDYINYCGTKQLQFNRVGIRNATTMELVGKCS